MIPTESLATFSVSRSVALELLRVVDVRAQVRERAEEELVMDAWRKGFLLVDAPAGHWRFFRCDPCGCQIEIPVIVALHEPGAWDHTTFEAHAVGRRVRNVALTG